MTTTPQTPAPAPGAVPPAPQPETPKQRSWFARHKILTGIGGLVLLIVIVNPLGGGGEDDPGTAAPPAGSEQTSGSDPSQETPAEEPADEPAEEPAEEPMPGIGATVADGSFEFVVTGVEAGVARIGNDYFGEDAQGQFILVHVTVTNIGDKAQYFLTANQKLIDTQDREHSDSSAGIYLDDAGWIDQINPGNTLQGTVVFDIPADAVPAAVRLHDSMFSGGVEVALQ